MRIDRPGVRAAFVAFAVSVALLPGPRAETPELEMTLELDREFYYEDDPIEARIRVTNPGEDKVRNPLRGDLVGGLRATTPEGIGLRTRGESGGGRGDHPGRLAGGASDEARIDLAAVFPELRGGAFDVQWEAEGRATPTRRVTVLRRFDPSKQYVAQIETDRGIIAIRLLSESPVARKTFVDLARAGFYDGLPFHGARAGAVVGAGDPRLADPPREMLTYPAEQSTLMVLPGTVVVQPLHPAPPTNGPAFLIALKPQPGWSGQVTVLGQVEEGLDVVRRISVEASPAPERPAARVTIRRVRIEERDGGTPPS